MAERSTQGGEARYAHRWVALSNTTLGVLMALVNSPSPARPAEA